MLRSLSPVLARLEARSNVQADTQAVFWRVIAKAAQLEKSRYLAALADTGQRVDFTGGGVRLIKPDDDSRDAFILTFRFFILQNERTSFRGLQAVLADDGVSDRWKESFRAVRSAINEYLDTAFADYEYGGATHRFTNREIMETFLYGGLVHANDPKAVARYEEWLRYPGILAVLEMWFLNIILTLLRAIRFLSVLCEAELRQTSGQAGE